MKKWISTAAILCFAVAVSAVPAVAGHHGGGHHKAVKSYTVCPVETCVNTELHLHDGLYYAAHHSADGHSYHEPVHVHSASCGHNLTGRHHGGHH